MVKRWTNEINEALSSDNVMVQYHALGLMYSVKKHDRLAVSKLLAKYTKAGVRSPYATCLLVCFADKLNFFKAPEINESFRYNQLCLLYKRGIVIIDYHKFSDKDSVQSNRRKCAGVSVYLSVYFAYSNSFRS